MNRQSFLLFTYAAGSAAEKYEDDGRAGRLAQAFAGWSGARGRHVLEELREEFPFLADAAAGFLPGEGRVRSCIDLRTRHLAAVAVAAATGDGAGLRLHAAVALDGGARQDELKEIVYLTAAREGLARAIDAARTLSALLAERWEAGRPVN